MRFIYGSMLAGGPLAWYLKITNETKTLELAAHTMLNSVCDQLFDPHWLATENRSDGIVGVTANAFAKVLTELSLGCRDGWIMNAQGGMNRGPLATTLRTVVRDRWPIDGRIEIKKWPKGIHYYAKVDGDDVVDEAGNVKWLTKEDAAAAAEKYIRQQLARRDYIE